jgi:hypothetical protein
MDFTRDPNYFLKITHVSISRYSHNTYLQRNGGTFHLIMANLISKLYGGIYYEPKNLPVWFVRARIKISVKILNNNIISVEFEI